MPFGRQHGYTRRMRPREIDNTIYEAYGDRWYTAFDDPVAILRAETRVKIPWIIGKLDGHFGHRDLQLLDVGCGGGFVSNALSAHGIAQVTGIDLSPSSLDVARRWDRTARVNYVIGDAYHLPMADSSFDCVTALDVLEHVENPALVIKECARVLRPGGLFLFQTLNRNWVAGLVGIKFIEWFVRNTAPDMHLLRMFIKPAELTRYCEDSGLRMQEITGIRPRFSTIPLKSYFERVVPEQLEFQLTRSRLLAYMGCAQKERDVYRALQPLDH